MIKKTPVLAWHFVGATLRDGSPIPADGVTLKFNGRLELCASGFHASRRLIDALQYAPGATLCRVECGGTIKRGTDKLVCHERTIIWRIDAADLLRLFARQCALDVIHLWIPPDVVRQYLETGDENLRDAAWAASAASAKAAWAARADNSAAASAANAAIAAAWADGAARADRAAKADSDCWAVSAAVWAAWSAARAAKADSARADSAWAAARAATDAATDADSACWDAVRNTQNERLEKLAYAAHEASK